SIPLNGSGVATLATSAFSVATHTITAVYSGNALYNTSTSTTLSQVVSKAATATALASSLNPSCSGQPVTLTAAVSAVAPGSGIPTGSVNFKDGSTVIGSSIPLNGSGVATFTTSSLSVANHNLTALYNGSGNFNTSTSSPVLVHAVKAKPAGAKSVGERSAAPFAAAAAGSGLTYRGRKDGVNPSNGGHVSGATGATLTINPAAAAGAGSYDVVVSGICPPALTSNAASLTV